MNIDILVVSELNEELIASKIYKIRGQKVMLDFELAEIYGYETKNFNRQVKIIMISLMKILCFN